MNNPKQIGTQIKKEMAKASISRFDLASNLGMSQNTVNKLISGELLFSFAMIKRVARLIKSDTRTLLFGFVPATEKKAKELFHVF